MYFWFCMNTSYNQEKTTFIIYFGNITLIFGLFSRESVFFQLKYNQSFSTSSGYLDSAWIQAIIKKKRTTFMIYFGNITQIIGIFQLKDAPFTETSTKICVIFPKYIMNVVLFWIIVCIHAELKIPPTCTEDWLYFN